MNSVPKKPKGALYLEEGRTIGRACARDLDGLAIGAFHSAIAVSRAYVSESVFLVPEVKRQNPTCRVHTGVEAEIRCQS